MTLEEQHWNIAHYIAQKYARKGSYKYDCIHSDCLVAIWIASKKYKIGKGSFTNYLMLSANLYIRKHKSWNELWDKSKAKQWGTWIVPLSNLDTKKLPHGEDSVEQLFIWETKNKWYPSKWQQREVTDLIENPKNNARTEQTKTQQQNSLKALSMLCQGNTLNEIGDTIDKSPGRASEVLHKIAIRMNRYTQEISE